VPGGLAGAVLLAGILQSGSRSGLVALAVVGLVLAYRFGGTYAAAAFTLVGAVAYAGLAYIPALAGLPAIARLVDSSATENSDEGRIELMRQALGAILDGNYVIGTGFVADRLPHNVLLFVWGGFGLLGLVVFLWVVTVLVAPAVNRQATALSAALALGCLGFLTAVALNNLVGAGFFWLIAGLSMFRIVEPHGSSPARPSLAGHPVDLSRTRGSFW
jgi:O-antigen ligase